MSNDYYKILGVEKGASQDEIKKAYRKLAQQHHPDVHQDPQKKKEAEVKFKEISGAYDIVGDETKRANYDQFGSSDGSGGGGGFGGGGGAGFEGFNFNSDVFGDLFGDFFGGGGRQTQKRSHAERGSDLRYKTELTLEEMFRGTEITISYTTKVQCGDCKGHGGENGAKPIECSVCHGAGKVRQQKGPFIMEQTCQNCKGVGTVLSKLCKNCHGVGAVNKAKKLVVKIPAGIDNGEKIRMSGEGEAGSRGGEAGDLYVEVYLKPHKFFKRKKSDLFCDAPISFTTAALGGIVNVPSIDGRNDVNLTIPAGTQNGTEFRLKENGMNFMRSSRRGDLFVTVQIEVPINLNAKQKELLGAFEKELDGNSTPKSSGFLKKVKDFWSELNKGGEN